MKAKISVLMPVYNAAPYLAEAIQSILHQTFDDFEFLVIDDGSRDGSLEILRRFEERDARIHVISRENKGLVYTRNELLAEAAHDLVAWADADDISHPQRLARQLRCFDDPSVVWATAGIRLVDPDGRPIRDLQLGDDPGFTGVAMMRKRAAVELGGFRTQFRICEDRDLELRMREIGRVVSVNEVLLDYRQHPKSVCNAQRRAVAEYTALADALAEERRSRGSDRIQRGEAIHVSVATDAHAPLPSWRIYARWGWWALAAGNVATARRYAARAVLCRPWSLRHWILVACALRGR